MTPFRLARYLAEIVGLLAGFLLIPLLPRSIVVAMARGIGRVAYRTAKRDREIASANIRIAFGDSMSDEAVEDLVKESMTCFALVLLDLFWFSFMSQHRVKKYVRLAPEYDWSFGERPFVYLTAHFGNWEVLGLATALKVGQLLSVAAPLENRVADKMLKGMRRGTGQTIISKYGAVRGLVRALKKKGKVALVVDQNTLPADGGCFVDLFGVPAPMSMAAASLMLHARCDAGFVISVPDQRGYYDAVLLEKFAAEDYKDLSPEELTGRIAGALEKAVQNYPGKWLWSYKRWKFVPDGENRDKFPFYSRSL